MKSTTSWLNKIKPEDVDMQKLAKVLSLDENDPRLKAAGDAFLKALQDQLLEQGDKTDLTQLKNDVASLEKALGKMSTVLKGMQHQHFLDEHYCLANDEDMLLMNLQRQPGKHDSGFAIVVERLANAVDDFKTDALPNPGKGRIPETTYTLALISLADFFEEAFPEHPLTHNKRTAFANFAGLWLESVSDADPQTHIKTALNKRAANNH